MEYPHIPVLVEEVTRYLVTDSRGVYVDGTSGSGGHSAAVAERLDDEGRIICLDRDPDAVALTARRLAFMGERAKVVKGSYADLGEVLGGMGIEKVHGVLLDLGMSSLQLDGSGRGFSFRKDEPLDMRMDPEQELTARSLVNTLPREEIADILKTYGEERMAKRIAGVIVGERSKRAIETTFHLAALIESAVPPSRRFAAGHPAVKSFQAFRIAVNGELRNVRRFLAEIPSLLVKGGRLAVLSYHSLEDRLIKQAMVGWERACVCPPDLPVCGCGKVPLFVRLFKKGLRPGDKEIELNQRARSAVLRVAERVQP